MTPSHDIPALLKEAERRIAYFSEFAEMADDEQLLKALAEALASTQHEERCAVHPGAKIVPACLDCWRVALDDVSDVLAWLNAEQKNPTRWVRNGRGIWEFAMNGTELNRLRLAVGRSEYYRLSQEQALSALAALREAHARLLPELELLRKRNVEVWSNPQQWMKWCDEKMLAEVERLKAELGVINRIAKIDSIDDALENPVESDMAFRLRMFAAVATLRVELMANKGHPAMVQSACDAAVASLQRAEAAEHREAALREAMNALEQAIREWNYGDGNVPPTHRLAWADMLAAALSGTPEPT